MGQARVDAVRLRPARPADAEDIARVHHAAVHHTASGYYPPEVLEDWSPLPDEDRCEQARRAITSSEELLIVAQQGSRVVGFGAVVPARRELRAVYVHPDYGRRGIGSLILARLEQMAVERGVDRLLLDASVNAEVFYRNQGYRADEHGVHRLGSGREMACVKMSKVLIPSAV